MEEDKIMKLSKKLVKIGRSLGIIIDKPIVDKLKLRKGDWIETEITKVQ